MKYLVYISIFSISISAFSCSSDKQKTGETSSTAPEPQVTDTGISTYEAAGRVISILPNKKNFIVRHGDIPGFMGAMTMPFTVTDSTVLSNISPRDSIHFIIETKNNQTYVTEIKKIDPK